jgi:hypothetical protein
MKIKPTGNHQAVVKKNIYISKIMYRGIKKTLTWQQIDGKRLLVLKQ